MIDPSQNTPLSPPPARKRRRAGAGAWVFIVMIVVSVACVFSLLALTGKPIRLPVWAVAEVEARLNRAFSNGATNASVSVGDIEVMVDRDWVPRLAMEDVRILQSNGSALVTLPEIRASFHLKSLLKGSFNPETLRIVGGRFAIKRRADGKFDFDFGTAGGAGSAAAADKWASFADILDAADTAFSNPTFGLLTRLEAEGLTLMLTDARSGQQWQAGDGRLVLENRKSELAAELSLSLAVDQTAPATVVLTSISQKASPEARMTATVAGIAARDLAAQVAPLAWLGALDAPISGRLAASFDVQGQLGRMESTLEIGAGVLRPTPQTAPIAFDRAGLSLAYDPEVGRIALSGLSVESPSLRFSASGQSYLLGPEGVQLGGNFLGAPPDAFLAQISFSEVSVDPAGLFEVPVRFSQGALDLRLTLQPFAVEIGQLTLTEKDRQLSLKGQIAADPKGWRVALDVALNEIQSDELIALWPVQLVTKTREWLALNVLDGTLFNVKAAVRLAPATEPRLLMGYEFSETDVRFLKALPPVKSGSGYSSIEGQTYSLVLEKGFVTPPLGGDIDVAGTVFKIPDISQKPTVADITLATDSSLTASLSLLNQPPFEFLTKAKRPVTLGQGHAKLVTRLRFPLKAKVLLEDVDYAVSGQITDFQSDVLVQGRRVTAPALSLRADPDGLLISGKGLLGALPFDVTFQQEFGLHAKGRSHILGKVDLSDEALRDLGIGLPKGMIKGNGQASIKLDLIADQPAQMVLTTDLRGLGLSLPALGWTKPVQQGGRLELTALLGKVPIINSLSFEGAGLKAEGNISLRDEGGLGAASFDRVQLDDWLDVKVTLEGRGEGRAVGVNILSGEVDLRRLAVTPRQGNDGTDGPLSVRLDRLTVSDGIALTKFDGDFSSVGGFNGTFLARVNGSVPVRGTVVPSPGGSAVRITSEDAGSVMAAAGVFKDARGGALDLTLTPTGAKGEYQGRAKIGTIRVQNASVLAELLSAISVVGVLEQLNGSGLVFTQTEVDFRLTPDAVEVTRGSAIGASLGVSMAGIYSSETKALALQGVISPIYLLNGIGSFLTRKGEGFFGFNYKIRGTVDMPKISVNPLSILTPGMFRDLFRKPAPVLPKGNG